MTAQKRETMVEDTPIAVSAFTPDFIDRNRILSLDDLALRTPSVAFVQLNADYRDMQTNQFNPQTGLFETSNVGRARAKGIELETTAALTNWLTRGINYAYQLARYNEYVQSAAQNNTGNAIPETPKHSVNLNAETKFVLGSVPRGLQCRRRLYIPQRRSFR